MRGNFFFIVEATLSCNSEKVDVSERWNTTQSICTRNSGILYLKSEGAFVSSLKRKQAFEQVTPPGKRIPAKVTHRQLFHGEA